MKQNSDVAVTAASNSSHLPLQPSNPGKCSVGIGDSMPGTTPEKRSRQDISASESEVPKLNMTKIAEFAVKGAVLKWAKLSENAYAPSKGKTDTLL